MNENKTKTLIGKDGYLFLHNDTCKEIETHCNNVLTVQDTSLSHYDFENYYITIFPDKSVLYKDFLPYGYISKYRPAFDVYNNKFQHKLLNSLDFLQHEKDTYYKTDTHINLKGNYLVYCRFIENINNLYHLDVVKKNVDLLSIECVLNKLPYGIGDLTWETNLGNQIINEINDLFYYSSQIEEFYPTRKITSQLGLSLRFYDYNMNDETNKLIETNSAIDWNVISNYIIYKKNNTNKQFKCIVFYDSFLLSILPLYLDLFHEVYMVKSIYNKAIIEKIQPDYVFEFRVERFLT